MSQKTVAANRLVCEAR